jgi:hypothetical protein
MAKTLRITCPSCRRSGLRLRPEHLGRRILCKHCGAEFQSSQEHFTRSNGRVDPALKEARGRVEWLEARLREAQARFDEAQAQLDAARARLGDEVAGLRSAAEQARRAMAEASRQAGQGARAAALARLRADRPGPGREGGQDEPEWALNAPGQDPKDASPRPEPEPEGQGTLAEAITGLELRFLDILCALNPAAGPGRWAEPGNGALRNGGAGPEEVPGGSEEAEGVVGELARRLAEARRSNQRLRALLGVLGMSREAASKMTRPAGPPAALAVDETCPQTSQA